MAQRRETHVKNPWPKCHLQKASAQDMVVSDTQLCSLSFIYMFFNDYLKLQGG